MTIDDLRRFAVARNFASPAPLLPVIQRLGFVQADPIRAPARAQDLTLRQRVQDYRAGDLEAGYPVLDIEEDHFINYGFVTRGVHDLMHPRGGMARRSKAEDKRARALLDFVRERGPVHPREVDRHFSHGSVKNYWGGSSTATTHLLSRLHYRGELRVARREAGIRLYAARERPAADDVVDGRSRQVRVDALVDVVVAKYAPVPAATLSTIIGRLRYGVPQWHGELKSALERARERLAHAGVSGVDGYWPADEKTADAAPPAVVRLLTPFDPLVWDRRRFELFWGWAYRFEAYTPVAKRRLGYYALPLLWGDRVIGWANVSLTPRGIRSDTGYEGSAPRSRAFRRELACELDRMRAFLQ